MPLTPAQDFDHLLDPVSGYNGMHDLQKKGKCSEVNGIIYRGSLVSIDPADGLIKAGLVLPWAMAMWAINSSQDFDVNGDTGNVATQDMIVGSFPATCGMELKTTEFDIADLASLVPQCLLTPSVANPGWVKAAAPDYSANAVVGVVSDGVMTEVYGQKCLVFWPVWMPAISCCAAPSSSATP